MEKATVFTGPGRIRGIHLRARCLFPVLTRVQISVLAERAHRDGIERRIIDF